VTFASANPAIDAETELNSGAATSRDESEDSAMVETLVEPRELRAITSTHEYAFPMKLLASWTLAITAVMGGLYFLVGFPPAFDTYFEKMYFHAIGIGIAALVAYLVLDVFELEADEPALDFPIRYRAFLAVIFGAAGGLVFISPAVSNALPDVGVLLFVVAFLLIFDVTAALLVELIILPRKRAGVYESRSRNFADYVGRIIPFRPADRAAYHGLGVGYWLAVISIASAAIAMVIGFINLWVRAFGPSFFAGYMGWLGLDAQGFQAATLDPHSHMVAIAIIALIVAVAIVRFGVLDAESRLRRRVASLGGWIAFAGVILMTLVLGAVAFLNFAPPTLFTSGPDAVNGIAGDDLVMSIVFVGALIVAAAMAGDRRIARSGLRLTILGTWAASVAITAVVGFYIELNEQQFGGTLAANDHAFSAAHPMTGIFVMIVLSLALLLVDFYAVPGRARKLAIATGALGLVAATAGTLLWTLVDPSTGGFAFGLYIAGIALAYVTVLVAGLAVRSAHTQGFNRTAP
jgi:hypothetical protein